MKPVLLMMPHPFASGHRRMTNCTSAMLDDGTAPTPYRQFDCNPSDVALNYGDGCQTHDCAHPVWRNGCEACMCFNPANAAWCDGLEGDYYDKYFEEHGENPWGDSNVKNRKCNTEFKPPPSGDSDSSTLETFFCFFFLSVIVFAVC